MSPAVVPSPVLAVEACDWLVLDLVVMQPDSSQQLPMRSVKPPAALSVHLPAAASPAVSAAGVRLHLSACGIPAGNVEAVVVAPRQSFPSLLGALQACGQYDCFTGAWWQVMIINLLCK